jgi:hypothetical protein
LGRLRLTARTALFVGARLRRSGLVRRRCGVDPASCLCHFPPDLGVVPSRGGILPSRAFVEPVQSLAFALLGRAFTFVGSPLTIVGGYVAVIGDPVALVGDAIPFLSGAIASGLLGFALRESLLSQRQLGFTAINVLRVGAPVTGHASP